LPDDDLIILYLRPQPNSVPVSIRLRAALKTLLRRDHLLCLGVGYAPLAAPVASGAVPLCSGKCG
jgi:hypothetical protein